MSEIDKEIRERFAEAEREQMKYEEQWYLSCAFLYGKQWIEYDNFNKKIIDVSSPSYKIKVVSNKIFPVVRQLVSKLGRNDINLVCLPIKKDEKSKSTARTGNKVIKYVLDSNNIRTEQYKIALYILTFGKCYIKTFWDYSAFATTFVKTGRRDVEPQILYPEDDIIRDNLLKQETEEAHRIIEMSPQILSAQHLREFLGEDIEKINETQIGDIKIEVLRPDYVYVDPLADTIKEARYAFIVKARSKEYVLERYGVDVEEREVVAPSIQNRLNSIMKASTNKRGVLVKEYFERRSNKHPNGRMVIMANEKVILDKENPYVRISNNPMYDIPLTEITYFPNMLGSYSTSVVEQLIPLQKEYNRLRSDIVQHEALLQKGKWLIPIGCNIPKTSITSEPGEKVYYDPRGGIPTATQGVPPPPGIWNHIIEIKNEFNDIAGLHEVSRGRAPGSGIRAASAIMFLQEQDDMQLAVTNNNMINGFIEIGKRIILLAREFYIEDRLLKITGRGTDLEIFEFKKGALDEDNFDVSVEAGSRTPFSYVAKQQFILSLYNAGIIQDKDKVLRLLEFTTEDDIYDSNDNDELNARMENEIMAQGQYPEVQEYDNHAIHLKVLNGYRKNPDFKKLPPQIQQLFSKHAEYHTTFIELEQQRILAQMMQLQDKGAKASDKQEKQSKL